jgi:excisionase family DNA binding protein
MAAKRRQAHANYLTTHQVAGVLGVSLPTVVNWVKAGRISAHKTPGGHRRIAREEVIRFSEATDYPLPAGWGRPPEHPRVLVVDGEPDFGEMVGDYLDLNGAFDVRVVDNPFAAGLEIGRFKPHVVVLDMAMSELDALGALDVLQTSREEEGLQVIACTPVRDPILEQRLADGQIDAQVHKPVPMDQLLSLVRRMVR